MKRLFTGIAGIAILLLAATMTQAQQPPAQTQGAMKAAAIPATFNVKVIDPGFFEENIAELKARVEMLANEFDAQNKQLGALQERIKQIDAELAKGSLLKPEVVAQLTDQKDSTTKQGQRLLEDTQAAFKKREAELVGPVYEKVYKFLESYAQQRGISMILNRAAGQIIPYVGPDADITQDFVNEYNRQNPAATSANPAGQPKNPAPPPAVTKPKPGGKP